MQKLGKQQIFGHKNKNVDSSLGAMRECSDLYRRADAFFKDREAREARRAAEDARILDTYWAKKEELELLYKMRDGDKKQTLIKAKKAELDQMYSKYVCIRKAVWERKQAKKEAWRNAELQKLPLELVNLPGSVMSQAELDKFLAHVGGVISLSQVAPAGDRAVRFSFDDRVYSTVRTKKGYLWQVDLY